MLLLDLVKMSSHVTEERAVFADSKSAKLYLQILLLLLLAVLFNFHFSDTRTPLWSDEPRGGNTEQEDIIDELEIITKSIREVEPDGLVCVGSGTTCTREKLSIKLHNWLK